MERLMGSLTGSLGVFSIIAIGFAFMNYGLQRKTWQVIKRIAAGTIAAMVLGNLLSELYYRML